MNGGRLEDRLRGCALEKLEEYNSGDYYRERYCESLGREGEVCKTFGDAARDAVEACRDELEGDLD